MSTQNNNEKASGKPELPSVVLESVGYHKGYKAAKANAETLAEALRELFTQCAMVHKYWGDGCNQAEADAAVSQACKALAAYDKEAR